MTKLLLSNLAAVAALPMMAADPMHAFPARETGMTRCVHTSVTDAAHATNRNGRC